MDIHVLSFDIWKTLIRASPEYTGRRGQLIAECVGWSGDPIVVVKAVNKAYRELGKVTDGNGYQFGLGDWVGHAAKTLGLTIPSDERLTEFQEQVIAAHLQYLPALTEPDLVDTFRQHHVSGYKLAVISNTSMTQGATLRLILDTLGLLQYITYELYSDVCGYAKPDSRIFGDLVALSVTEPARILHVGDNQVADYQGAKNAGLRALQYAPDGEVTQTTFQRHSELFDHPVFRD